MAFSSNLTRKLALLQQSTITQALNAFSNMFELKQIHAHIIKSDFNPDLKFFLTTRLLVFAAISNSGELSYAKTLFNNIKYPSHFMYNTMIRGYSQSNQPIGSIHLYVQMLQKGIFPDKFTYPFLIRSCCLCSLFLIGKQIHSHVLKFGFCLDVYVVNNLISMYSGCGELDNARNVFEECFNVVDIVSWTTLVTGYSNSGGIDVARKYFDEMPQRNTVSWNAMVAGYARGGQIVKARELFDEMPEKDVASWSVMISGYSQSGMAKEAMGLFQEMVSTGFMPNESALVSAVSACAQLRALDQGEWLHNYIKEHMFEVNVILGTALLDMYGKCGNVEKAFLVFNKMPIKNVMTWNSMIAGLFLNGCGKQALALFEQMQKMGPPPNNITFIGLLTGCSHLGMVHEGHQIFNIMTQVYKIKPQLEHYGCMVDLLGRAGLIKEALDFVEKMPVEPHPGLWGALVSACRIHGEIELGEELGKHLIKLEPQHSGRYMLLLNMFAAANRWDDVARMRNLLKEKKVLKNPGNSIIKL
ncbi:hypothetical protein AQUCO_03800027v1 [Aquilegia coerulea]|uniref:Pentacotripeptide-repeat region of PRORP domain-containing protein n=1 Tax=Aquilegia coerulea TaxID=218851 RepID=A0A2G5CS91_AQUCA|nr:hypothetical protein AQUCO_03800027v1 [Aquilegia coerulea]